MIITLIVNNLSLELIQLFDKWISINKESYPFIVGRIITQSYLPKGFYKVGKNINYFESISN